MIRFSYNPLMIIAVIFAAYGCNPDCDSVINMSVTIASSDAILADRENQILLRSSPPNFLEGRSVFIDGPTRNARRVKIEKENTRFDTTLNGLIVTIPESFSEVGTPSIYVDDPDCSSDVLRVQEPLQIRTEDFFFFSDVFVVPPIPIVIIPTPAVAPPANITNAWVTPYSRDYCIWFVPELNGDVELPELRPWKKDDVDNGLRKGSHEFVVCDAAESHHTADHNPVSGFVDKEANMIEIKIDRTDKDLGVERFSGMFIDPEQLPDTEEWRHGFAGCGSPVSDIELVDFMLLTSHSTGAQLMMIKINPKKVR